MFCLDFKEIKMSESEKESTPEPMEQDDEEVSDLNCFIFSKKQRFVRTMIKMGRTGGECLPSCDPAVGCVRHHRSKFGHS